MSDNQELYDARLKRVSDAVKLIEPDRVPIVPCFQAFPVYYACERTSVKHSIKDLLEDYKKAAEVYDVFYEHFMPDLGWDPILFFPTQYMEASGISWFRWPGRHFDDTMTMYQYIEGDYMKADEYSEATRDLTKFMMNKWIPRSFSNLQGMAKVDFRNAMWFGHMGEFAAFSDPEVIETFEALAKTGRILLDWFTFLGDYQEHMKEKFAMPPLYASFAYAPFDMVGDSMRGTTEILMDMYDRPEELLAMIDVVKENAIEDTIAGSQDKAVPYVWYWLHKGVDDFMSNDQFAKFYWPSLRDHATAVADAGLTPVIYVEGAYNNRLEFLKELPPKKCILNFEYTDMAAAKTVLGGHSCIAGNVKAFSLSSGTKEDTVNEVKQLIDTCAPGGGYILDTGTMVDDAKVENIEAMFETVEIYGKK
jgi:uroporphyrinogen-III decarboxylase